MCLSPKERVLNQNNSESGETRLSKKIPENLIANQDKETVKNSVSTIKETIFEEEEYLYINRMKVKTVRVPISISGISCFAVVDTGAEATILNINIYEQIPEEVRPPLSQAKKKLVVAEAGKEMSVCGMTEIDVEIGGFKFKWPVYVAPIRDDFLLGWDMIYQHKFAIDPDKGFQVKGDWINIEIDSPKRKSAATEINQAVTNPKSSEFILCCKCQNQIEGDYFKEPIVQNRVVVVEAMVTPQENSEPVRLSNLCDLQKQIPNATVVGKPKKATDTQDPNYSNVNSESLDLPNLISETSSHGTFSQQRVENKSVKASYREVAVPKMLEVVLRGICEETESSRIEENMYKRGDLVYIYKQSQSHKKLERPWEGPFIVRKCVSPSEYLLQGKKKTIIVHRDRLKPCLLEENDLPRWARKVVAHCRVRVKSIKFL